MLRIERDGNIAIWTIARPEAKNALDFATLSELLRAIGQAAQDRALRAVVLTGEGSTFVSGGDLRELRVARAQADAERLSDTGRQVCRGLVSLDVPVIAALPGPAIGGGAELALACDLRIAEERAKICFKQVRMGLTTAWGTLPRLLSMVGPATASRLLLTGHEIGAMEARALRLVDYVAENGTGVAMALAWAMDVTQGSPRAVAEMKMLLREAWLADEWLRARERERFVATWLSPDHFEAVEAYFASRPPVWRSR